MKPFRAFVCCLLTALIFSSAIGLTTGGAYARADAARYARADAKDVYLCREKDLNTALFAIPYTYCVEILSVEGDWYRVQYAEDTSFYKPLRGYCPAANLTPVDEPPENIYLNMPVTVTYRTDAPEGSLPVLSELNVTAAFYGTYYSGATAYSYVLYDGQFGYIYGANDDYPLNEIPEPAAPAEKSKGSGTRLITAFALAGVAAAALIILYVTGRKRYKPYV